MMAYEKTIWVDHEEDPITGEVYTQGTPVDAAHLNKMEQGIAGAQSAAETALRFYTTETEPDDPGPYIWMQPVGASGPGLLALENSPGDGLNVALDGQTLAVTNADAAEGDDPLRFTIR